MLSVSWGLTCGTTICVQRFLLQHLTNSHFSSSHESDKNILYQSRVESNYASFTKPCSFPPPHTPFQILSYRIIRIWGVWGFFELLLHSYSLFLLMLRLWISYHLVPQTPYSCFHHICLVAWTKHKHLLHAVFLCDASSDTEIELSVLVNEPTIFVVQGNYAGIKVN